MSTRLLVDSHVFLWLAGDPARFSGPALAALSRPDAQLYLSAVGIAELCIKNSLGKLPLPSDIVRRPAAGFRATMSDLRIEPLALTVEHAVGVRDLPLHHRDPFDRLMIAQAMAEGLTLVTHDRAFAQYDGLSVLWV